MGGPGIYSVPLTVAEAENAGYPAHTQAGDLAYTQDLAEPHGRFFPGRSSFTGRLYGKKLSRRMEIKKTETQVSVYVKIIYC